MSAAIGATFVIPLENGQWAAARILDNEGGVTFAERLIAVRDSGAAPLRLARARSTPSVGVPSLR